MNDERNEPVRQGPRHSVLPDGTLLDCTLREGPYECRFDTEGITRITRALVAAGVRHVEVGAETGFGSRPDVDDIGMVMTAREAEPGVAVGVIAGFSRATPAELRRLADAGASFVRVAAAAPLWKEALATIGTVRSLGMSATFNAIKGHSVSAAEFGRLARETTSAGADVVYLVDSAGTMLASDVRDRVSYARDAGARVGFHGHDNFSLAVANSLVAVAEGAVSVDGTLRGIGRSAGNAQIEVLAAALRKQGSTHAIDVDALARAAEELIAPHRARDRGIGHLDLCMGEGGFHSEGLDAAREAAERYGVALGPLLREAGRRDPAGADHDTVVRTALALRVGASRAPSPRTTGAEATA
ncbi:hypothetical protein ACIQUL_29950 [Streptomyces sp. NPDC090303]|uniref:hypothetical protein n=1 Tax=Streptomyces sp. NPDC090303 TaxID=3365960 RepID=UPI00381627C4